MNDGGNDAGGGRDGHPDEVFAVGAAGIFRDGVDADVEAGETAGSAEKEEKADEGAELNELEAVVVVHHPGEGAESPGEGEDAGGDAEGDDVGEGIELAAEVAFGVGEAGDAAIEGVERDGEADGDGGVIEMMRREGGAFEALGDGEEAGRDVDRGEERGQDEHAAGRRRAHGREIRPSRRGGGWAAVRRSNEQLRADGGEQGIGVAEGRCGLRRWLRRGRGRRGLTSGSAWPGRRMSVREPNLMRPTRSPRWRYVAGPPCEDDAAGEQAGDLDEGDRVAFVAVDDGEVLLVALGAGGVHGVEVFALAVANLAQNPGDRRAVDVNVEDAEEDADTETLAFRRATRATSVTLPSAGETMRPGSCGIERRGSRKNQRKKECEEQRGERPPPGSGEEPEESGHCEQRQSIEIAVTDHGKDDSSASGQR